MAAQTAKLPAPQPTGKAPVAAAVAKAAAAPKSEVSAAGGFKLLAWMLVVLNLLAAGGWLYFKFFKNAQQRTTLEMSRKRLVTLKSNFDLLVATVNRIVANNVNEVSDPAQLVLRFTQPIKEHVEVGKVNKGRFHRTNYEEKVVRIKFLNQRGYEFQDIVQLLTTIEAANPTVQIKDVNFGTRHPPTVDSDNWRVDSATVRTLQLMSADG